MQKIRYLRLALWIAVAMVAATYGLMKFNHDTASTQRLVASLNVTELGGSFSLTDHRGASFTDRDVAGRPYAVFFGFTHCPDVCPTTLFSLTQLMQTLGSDADRLKVLFVTVDPQRDTAEQLATYMSSFDPRITALTGDMPAIDRMVGNFKAYYRKVPNENGYTMDHTAVVYLMGADGRFVSTLDMHEASEVHLAKLRRLLKNS